MTTETFERKTLKDWLRYKDMTVSQLARKLEKSAQIVYKWIDGTYRPDNSHAVHKALGLEDGQIIWGNKDG